MTMSEHLCPQCGEELTRSEDPKGVMYQCHALDCLGFFHPDEIEEAPKNSIKSVLGNFVAVGDSTITWGGPDNDDSHWRVEAMCHFVAGAELPVVHMEFYRWNILKRTAKGAWVERYGQEKFVLNDGRKKWAYPTKSDAWDSYRHRQKWRASYHHNEGRRIEAIKKLVDNIPRSDIK